MREIKEKKFKILLVIMNLVVILKLVKNCFRIVDFNYALVGFSIILGVIIYLIFSILLNRVWKKVMFLFIFFLLSGVMIYIYSGASILEEIQNISSNINYIDIAVTNESSIDFQQFAHMFLLGIPLITAVLIGITEKIVFAPLFITGSMFIGFWYLIFYKMVIPNIPCFIALVVSNLGIIEFKRKNAEYIGREIKLNLKISQIVIIILCLSVIIPLMALILPQEYKGKNIEGIMSHLRNEFAGEDGKTDPVEQALKGSFSMRQSGYNDSSSVLGGSIRIDDSEVFKVKADKPCYLRGKAMDYYTGKSWVRLDENIAQVSKINRNANTSMEKINNNLLNNSIIKEVEHLTITPSENFKTTSYFTPNNSYNVTVDNEEENLYVNDTLSFFSNKGIVEPYDVAYLSYGDFDNYLEGIENDKYISIPEDEDYLLPMRSFGVSDYAYLEYLNSIIDKSQGPEMVNIKSTALNQFLGEYSKYLQLDAPIDEGVFSVVENILEDEANKKGKEIKELTNNDKALAIRNYLKENYKYVINVDDDNQYNDFVSNFVLKEKEGYCTYFASASVIMCRIAGVPARYSQGFKMSEDVDLEGNYVVTNEDAHAWAEILVNPQRNQWAIVDSASTPTAYEQSLIKESMEESTEVGKPTNPQNQGNKFNKNDPGYELDDSGNVKNNIFMEYLWAFITVGSICLFIFLLIGIYQIKRIRVIKSNSVIPLYNYYLIRLKTIGIIKDANLGDLEFVKTVKDSELQLKLNKLVNQVYDEFYGEITIAHTDRQEDISFIESYLKNQKKWHRYIKEKYFKYRLWRN